jgi:hypothetical protein
MLRFPNRDTVYRPSLNALQEVHYIKTYALFTCLGRLQYW